MRTIRHLFTRRKRRNARRYIPKSLGVEGFFKKLNENDVRYACLRWHEDLPIVYDGEDIDMLVSDDHLAIVESVLSGTKSNGIPVDLYTVSGLPGTDYCTVPYINPELAAKALSDTVAYNGRFKIPDPVSYFFTMCYHVVYHKGLRSGLPESNGTEVCCEADHDYPGVLKSLAIAAGVPVPEMNLSHLDSLLLSAGFRPPTDTLRKYSKKNDWLRKVLGAQSKVDDPDLDGLVVFIVRERANRFTDEIASLLKDDGFEPIIVHRIAGSDVDRVANRLRGGNWNRGPWLISGGKPATAIVAYDCFPRMIPSPENPLESCNAAVQFVKERLRSQLRRRHPETEKYNAVHSSDTPKDALEYIAVIKPQLEVQCRSKAKQIRQRTRHRYDVIERLDNFGRRAKVERINFGTTSAICKTFRPGNERFLERELLARELLKDSQAIVPILERGRNYLVMPDVGCGMQPVGFRRPIGSSKPLLPIPVLLTCRNLIERFRREGYELIDFAPQNIVFDDKGNPHFIDFEFLQPSGKRTKGLVGNYAWWLPPNDFDGDYPVISRKRDVYARRWFAHTGLPRVIYTHVANQLALQLCQFAGFAVLSVCNSVNAVGDFFKKLRTH